VRLPGGVASEAGKEAGVSVNVYFELREGTRPIRYRDFASAVERVAGLRLARRGLTGRNPVTGAPIEIPLGRLNRLVEYRHVGSGDWSHALEFRQSGAGSTSEESEGVIVGFVPLDPRDPAIVQLAECLGARIVEDTDEG
jgi:hypothetical protein